MTASDPAAGERLKVAYVLHRFPYLTETFIVREMHWVREHGIDLSIFSLMKPKSTIRSRQAEELVPLAHYSGALTWDVVKAQFHFLLTSPLRYVRAMGRLIHQTYREPRILALMAALFPKSVYFAYEMEKMGIAHIHANFVWLEGLAAGVAKDLLGITFTIHPHAFGLFGRDSVNVRRELENASRIVTISDYHRRFIADLTPRIELDHIDVVHCGIEPDRIRPPKHRERNDPLRILAVGRAIEKKGHEYLIEACAELVARGRDFTCDLVVGDGGRRDDLQALINHLGVGDRVTLLGAHDEAGIFRLLGKTDIFALPCVVAESGDRDGIPVSLMEAMACEVPVVTTPVAGIPELVEDGDTGLLVAERSASDLADALVRLLENEELRRELGVRGRAKVIAEFNGPDSAARMAEIFRSVSKASSPV